MEDGENISTGIKDPVSISPKEQATFFLLDCMRKHSSHLINIFVVQALVTCEQRALTKPWII